MLHDMPLAANTWHDGPGAIPFVFEQAEGYVKAVEKSTLPSLGLREVFEPCTESYSANRESPKVII